MPATTSDEEPGPNDEAGAGDAGQDGGGAGEARPARSDRPVRRRDGEGHAQRQIGAARPEDRPFAGRSQRTEEHTSELQSLMRISYAVFCLKKKKTQKQT